MRLVAIAAASIVVSAASARIAAADDGPGTHGSGSGAEGRRGSDDKADCVFLEISATTAKDAVMEPELKPLEKKLKRPPFASWNSFRTLSKTEKTLLKQKAETLPLKVGTSSVILRDRAAARVNLGITIDGADGKRLIDTKPDVPLGDWLVIGTNAKDDGHLLALSCH